MVKCPNCGSTKIFRIRIDSDWGGGKEYYPVNAESEYTKEEYAMGYDDCPDVEINHCLNCHTMFE